MCVAFCKITTISQSFSALQETQILAPLDKSNGSVKNPYRKGNYFPFTQNNIDSAT